MIFGVNAVTSRLRRGDSVVKLLLRDTAASRRIVALEQLALSLGCPVERRSSQWFTGATRLSHQGVALVVRAADTKSESMIDELLAGNADGLLFLVLDGITDPRNLGACLRSAATLGVDAVIVPKDKSAPLNDAAIKTASGAAAAVPVVQVVNLSRCLDKLKKANTWIIGTLLDAESTIEEVDLTGNIALVLGAEDKGLRKKTVAHCDILARIPMDNDEFGFNVSVAAGICLYEAHRQRGLMSD